MRQNQQIIRTYMKSIGYKLLGKGQDSHVFSKEQDSVIKILMPVSGKVEHATKTFLPFLAYCLHHKTNPHLLRFKNIDGKPFAKFTIQGEDFYQISIEKLTPIPNGSLDEAVTWLFAGSAGGLTWKEMSAEMVLPGNWKLFPGKMGKAKIVAQLTKDGVDKYKLLYNTMNELWHFGNSKDLSWDLHTENCMMRSTDIVIVDPWFYLEI